MNDTTAVDLSNLPTINGFLATMPQAAEIQEIDNSLFIKAIGI